MRRLTPSLAALAVAVAVAGGCKKTESLVVFELTVSDPNHIGDPAAVRQVTLSVGGSVSRMFPLTTGLSESPATRLGVYVPEDVTGTGVIVAASAPLQGCEGYVWSGTANIPQAGATTTVPAVLRPGVTCVPDGGTGGVGGGGTSGGGGTTGAGGTATAGTSGGAGTSGSAGTSGNVGTSGGAGTTGSAGTTASGGRGGTTGSAGTTGAAGTTGTGGVPMIVPTLTRCMEVDHNGPGVACTGAGNNTISAVRFSPDGRFMVTSGIEDQRVRIWKFDGRTPTLDTPVLSTLGAGHLAFSPNGMYLAVGSQTGRVIDIYDVGTWTLRETFTSGFTGNIWGMDFAPDSQQVVSAVYETTTTSGRMFRHRLGGGAMVSSAISQDPNAIAVSPVPAANGNVTIAVADNSGYVGVLELTAAGFTTPTALTFSGSINNPTYAVRFSPDGKLLAAGNDSGQVVFWNVPLQSSTPTGTAIMTTNMSTVVDVAFTPDGQWLAIAAQSEASIWSVTGRTRRGRFVPPRNGASVGLSPNGFVMAVGEDECGKVLICAD